MSAPQHTTAAPPREPRGALRLRMSDEPGRDQLDGGWWPYTRDLVLEMSDLAQHFPREHGRIIRAVYARPDWDTAPRRIAAGPRIVRLGPFPGEDAHLVIVETGDHTRLTLLVIPPAFTSGQGQEALLAAATPGNAHAGSELLSEVTDQHDADPADWWGRSEDGTPGTRW
jgi:hypothetical protein